MFDFCRSFPLNHNTNLERVGVRVRVRVRKARVRVRVRVERLWGTVEEMIACCSTALPRQCGQSMPGMCFSLASRVAG